MKKVSTLKFVKGHLDKQLRKFSSRHKVLELVNRRTTKYGYEKVEVVWEEENEPKNL